MRQSGFLSRVALFWVGASSVCLGMGSGPHPHLLLGIPAGGAIAPENLPGGAGTWLFLLLAFMAVLIGVLRGKKSS